MHRSRFGWTAASVLAAAGVGLFAVTAASAAIVGNCTASLNRTDITTLPVDESHAVVVGKTDVVPMTMKGHGTRFEKLQIALTFAGFSWNVYDAPAGRGTWSHMIDVSKFAKYGVGLYEVHGVGRFVDGSPPCTGIAMVRVDGNPLTTVAGIAGTATAAVGVLGVLGAGLAAGAGGGGGASTLARPAAPADERRRKATAEDYYDKHPELRPIDPPDPEEERHLKHCATAALPLLLLLVFFGAKAGLMAVVAPVVRVERRSWPFVVGPLGGLLTGLGAGVLLQEYAVVYPTRTWTIVYLAGGIVFGFAVPWLRRMLAR